jgi:hypothetical protein
MAGIIRAAMPGIMVFPYFNWRVFSGNVSARFAGAIPRLSVLHSHL